MVKLSVRESGPGLAALKKALAEVRGSSLRVGLIAGKGGDTSHTDDSTRKMSIADIAAIHEFGSPKRRIPERSFLRSTFEENRNRYVNLLGRLLRQLAEGKMGVEKLLNVLGLKISTDVRKKITVEGVKPKNAPATIAAKKSDRPLVDTGQLARAITYAVERGLGDKSE